MSRKVFAASEVLAAADLNTFLMDQSVMAFASESARNTAIPFPVEGMVVYLEDTNNIRIYDGSSWIALPVGSGGTGATTLASGGYLKGAGTSAITSQSGIPAGDITSGTLPVGRGGTGASTLSSGAYLKGNGTAAIISQSGIPAGDITSGILPIERGGTGVGTGVGLTLITSQTFLSSTGFSLSNIFSSTYANYKIYISAIGSTNLNLNARFRTTFDDTNTVYNRQVIAADDGVISAGRAPNQDLTQLGLVGSTNRSAFELTVYSPYRTENTVMDVVNSSGFNGVYWYNNTSNHISTTAFTGMTIFPAVGNVSCTVRVYGIRN